MLQRILSLETETMNPAWMWLFRLDPPYLATAVVLSHISSMAESPQVYHIWEIIHAIFDKYISIHNTAKPPIVASLEAFRELTMPAGLVTTHSSMPNDGAAYSHVNQQMTDDIFSDENFFLRGVTDIA